MRWNQSVLSLWASVPLAFSHRRQNIITFVEQHQQQQHRQRQRRQPYFESHCCESSHALTHIIWSTWDAIEDANADANAQSNNAHGCWAHRERENVRTGERKNGREMRCTHSVFVHTGRSNRSQAQEGASIKTERNSCFASFIWRIWLGVHSSQLRTKLKIESLVRKRYE